MPRLIACDDLGQASLEQSIAALGERGFDPADEASLAHGAAVLRRLANNRSFLGDMLVTQLAARPSDAGLDSGYGPQAIVLSRMHGNCFLRANIWPSENDSCYRASGAKTFVYGVPHDHNFSFLTAGYFGPGYQSDYYEYEYESVAGWRGEKAELRFIERSALSEGRMMLYRAHRDIHSQMPPEAMSVSLNIMHIGAAQGWFDQYGFDLESGKVIGVLNPTSTETFLRCAVGLGGESALELAGHFGRHHPSDRMRLASYEACALLESREGADALWREAENCGSLMVVKEARLRREGLALP